MANLTQAASKSLAVALSNVDVAAEVIQAVADARAHGDQVTMQAKLIVATNVSQTVDFGSLLVGDKVVVIPAVAGNSKFVTCAVAGDLGVAAVVGSLYIVFRAVTLRTAAQVAPLF